MRPLSVSAAAAVTALVALAAPAWAQHGGGGAGASGHQAAQVCLAEFEQVVGEGRGFGLAFAADQNGYPGPMHVLELKERLTLSPEQEASARALMHAMFAASRPASGRLLEAEAKLRRLFAGGGADEASVRAAVGEVERLRAEVRLVHLLTHLKTRALLSEAITRRAGVSRAEGETAELQLGPSHACLCIQKWSLASRMSSHKLPEDAVDHPG